MSYLDRITIEPGKRSGKPCIRRMRITVGDLFDYLKSEMTEAEIIADFPELQHEDFLACYEWAAAQVKPSGEPIGRAAPAVGAQLPIIRA